MKTAENRLGRPLLVKNEATAIWAAYNRPQFAMVRNTARGEVITLAFIDVPLDISTWLDDMRAGKTHNGETRTIVAGSLLNPVDQLNRRVGRREALIRLENYLLHGVQKRHKDGRKADHFVVELTSDEITGGWQTRVAELMIAGTFIGQEVTA